IVELDGTAVAARRTREAAPRVLDQLSDGLAGPVLRPDAHDVDVRDVPALVGRMVALATAELLEPRLTERCGRPVGTTWQLLEGAGRAHPESRDLGESHLGPHGHRSARRVQQIEPEQDAFPARPVDLATPERVPDAVAIPALRVDGHEAAGHEERRLALEVEDLKAPDAGRRVRGVEGNGLPLGRLGAAGEEPEPPRLVACARDLGHVVAGEFLVAGAWACAVVVARRDEAEAEASRRRRIVEVRDGEGVLRRGARAVVERRVEAVAALAAVLPFLD